MNNNQILIDRFLSAHPQTAIRFIEELETEEIAVLIEALSLDQATDILSRLVLFKAGKVLEKVSYEHAVDYIEHLPISSAETILRICEKSIQTKILKGVQLEKANYLNRALTFEKDQVGAHLEPYVFTLLESMKIENALLLVKSSNVVIKPHVFVLDTEKKLVGYLQVNELITHNPERTIQSIMKAVPLTALAEMNTKDLLESWDDAFIDLPVVKANSEFLGTVSRALLSEQKVLRSTLDNSAVKAGNALGELYAIGLTSLLGSAENNLKS